MLRAVIDRNEMGVNASKFDQIPTTEPKVEFNLSYRGYSLFPLPVPKVMSKWLSTNEYFLKQRAMCIAQDNEYDQEFERDYSEDRHEILPEDQAHMDSIREEMKQLVLSRLCVGIS